ncbi:hypothetical protein GQ53DRAFT_833648 [Thozetella sp. PMI_491]|nr:hypothetical protein GQ53DRAFT_833648 [Thozetella sp. PMI_491]
MLAKTALAFTLVFGIAQASWLTAAGDIEAPDLVRTGSSFRVRHGPIEPEPRARYITNHRGFREKTRWLNSTTNCTAEPLGFGPVPMIDSPEAWLNLTSMTKTAIEARVPVGFGLVANGSALNGAIEAVGFEGFAYLETYDVEQCASWCMEKRECISFNIYYERAPVLAPADACPNPNSTTTIKCVFWGNELEAGLATNRGEMRKDFRLNPGANLTFLGFDGPRNPRVKAVFEPPFEPSGHYNTTLAFQTYAYRLGFYYNPEICAKACNERTERGAHDRAAVSAQYTNGAYDKCNMFTAFELHKNGVPHAMVCVEYSSVWDNIYGTWEGETSDKDETYAPKLVEVYTRSDYKYHPICADKEKCGDRFNAGGDCSGWGEGYCVVEQPQEQPKDA